MFKHVSIGILAWNEEPSIARTVRSLFAQSLFTNSPESLDSIEVLCVPNGCTDRTGEVVTQTLAEEASRIPAAPLHWAVHTLEKPSKANAWNHFVHEFSNPQADCLILLDADVVFHGEHSLSALVKALAGRPDVAVTTPCLIKDIAFKRNPSAKERLSLAVTRLHQKSPARMPGGLYCARSEALRRVRMPSDLLVEDGFLRAMIVTDGFRQPENLAAVMRVDESVAVFEAYTGLRILLRHEKRIIIGGAINTMLFGELAALPPEVDRADWVRDRDTHEPGWVNRLVADRVRRGKWWLLSSAATFRRFRQLRHVPPARRLLWLPLVAGAFVVEFPVFLAANAQLRRGAIEGAW